MITAPEVFGGTSTATSDPCPGYRKYVEVAFKCRPTQFREEKLRLSSAQKCGFRRKLSKKLSLHLRQCLSFRSKMACNGEPMNLACDGGDESRVAVYSAHFASAAGSHMYCPAPDSGSGIVFTT